jgi:predicted phage tail protein
MANPFLIFAAIFAVSAGVSYVQTKAAIKKAKQASKRNEGLLINSEGTSNYIPIIYGTRRVAGTRVFVATNDVSGGDPNEYLYLVYVLCEGEVDDITDILIDDLPTSDARFAYTNSIAINKFYGTDVQTADATFIAANIGWTSDHTLKGLAYITVRLKWNKDAFSSIPNITALVKGKKVYDPRSATTGYSTNPALCIRDYLTNTRYGKGLDVNVIDDNTFEDAADFYDTTVTFWTSGNTGKLFEFNAVIDTEKNIIDNLKDMLLCCRGFLPYTNGLYELIPDKSASSTFAFTTNNIIGGIAIKGESKQDKYNRVICNFIDPNNNWQENTAIWPDAGSAEEIAYLAEDGGTELVGDFDLPCITNYYAARDLARVFLARSRNAIRASLRATSDALNVTVGDVVTVTHPTPGWSAKPFQVEEVTINYDGTCTVSLLEYDSSIYTYDPASEQLSYSDTDLPNPFFVSPPSNLVITESSIVSKDGTVVREIYLDWSASTDAFVESYELQFKLSAATEYFSVFTFEPRYLAVYGDVGEVYNYRIRAINSLGVSSDFLTGTYTTVGDITAPAKPTGLSITGSFNFAVINWDYPTEKDYKETILYANTVNNFSTATEEGRISGSTITYYDLAENTTFYVWIKHEDFSGNVSVVSDVSSYTTSRGVVNAPTSLVITETGYVSPTGDGTVIPFVKISWTAPAQTVEYYELQYKEAALSEWVSVSVPTTSFETSGAKIGVLYDIRIRAINSLFGKSSYLTGTYTPVGDVIAPEKPTGLSIVGSAREAVISWDAALAKDYKETIIYSNSVNNSATATEEIRISGTTVTYYDLPENTTYYVWIKHEDFTGNKSVFSDVEVFTTNRGVINPPTSLVVSEFGYVNPNGDGTVEPYVRLSWTAPVQPVEYYELQFKESTATVWDSVNVATTSFETGTGKIGVAYDLRIRAVNVNFGKSSFLTGTYTPVGDLVAPEKASTPIIIGSYNEGVVSWTASTARDYKETWIYANTTNTVPANPELKISGTNARYFNLPLNTTYYVWIRHVDFTGNLGELSNVATFTTTTGITTSQIASNAATIFVGADAAYGAGFAIAETASNVFTNWTFLGNVDVNFGSDLPEEVNITLVVNYEGQGADTHIISLGLSTLYDELSRVNQTIVGAQSQTITIAITVPWADLAPPSGSTVSFRAWTKIGASGTNVDAINGFFTVLASRR